MGQDIADEVGAGVEVQAGGSAAHPTGLKGAAELVVKLVLLYETGPDLQGLANFCPATGRIVLPKKAERRVEISKPYSPPAGQRPLGQGFGQRTEVFGV